MKKKLEAQCAFNPLPAVLDDKFTSQEHEYICDIIMGQKNKAGLTAYILRIRGNYPDRKFTGNITSKFMKRFFK